MKWALAAGLAYFTIVFAAGFMLGTLRVMWLAPMLGEIMAVLLELPLMLAVSWLSCTWLVRRFAVPPQAAARLGMGAIAFTCLMLAEALLAVTLFGQSLQQFLSGFQNTQAQLGLAGQLAFALIPLLQAARR